MNEFYKFIEEWDWNVFYKNTREEEMCDRGWLMVIKNGSKN